MKGEHEGLYKILMKLAEWDLYPEKKNGTQTVTVD